MDAYKLLVSIVRSGVWDQDAEILDVGQWAWNWLMCNGLSKKEADKCLLSLARDEGIFFDGVEVDFLHAAEKTKDSNNALNLPNYELGDLCKFIPNALVKSSMRARVA